MSFSQISRWISRNDARSRLAGRHCRRRCRARVQLEAEVYVVLRELQAIRRVVGCKYVTHQGRVLQAKGVPDLIESHRENVERPRRLSPQRGLPL